MARQRNGNDSRPMNSDTAQSKSNANQAENTTAEQAAGPQSTDKLSRDATSTDGGAENSGVAAPDVAALADKAEAKANAAAPAARESVREQLLKSELAQLVLAIFRAPDQYGEYFSGKAELPKGLLPFLEAVADVGGQAPMRGLQDGQPVPPTGHSELVRAARYFIYKVLHISAADHYRVLGVMRDAKLGEIQQGYRVLRRLLGTSAEDDQANMAVMRLSEAYVVLRDPERRHAYDVGASLRLQTSATGQSIGASGRGNIESTAARSAKTGKRLSRSTYIALLLLSLVIYAGYYLHAKKLREEAALQESKLNQPAVPASASTSVSKGAQGTIGSESPAGSAGPTIGADAQSTLQSVDRFVGAGIVATAPSVQENKTPPHVANSSEPVKAEPVKQDSTGLDTRVAVIPIVPPSSSGDIAGSDDAVTKRRVSSLLARAQQQIKQGQITMPSGSNAHDTYSEILKIAPGNAEATAGLNGIADRYLGLARYRLNRDQLDDAEEMVVRGLAVASGHAGLIALRDKIASRRQELSTVQEKQSQTVIAAATSSSDLDSSSRRAQPSVEPTVTPATPTIPIAPASPVVAPPTVSEPAPQTATPSAASDEIKDQDLNALLEKFVFHYEAGQLEPFMALFAADAQTNNRTTRAGVADDYRSLFESSISRVMRLRDLRWNRQAQQAFGETDFSLSIVSRGEVRPRSYEGRLTFQVVRQDGQLLIRGLFHSQRKTNGQ